MRGHPFKGLLSSPKAPHYVKGNFSRLFLVADYLHHCRTFIKFRCQSSLHQSPIRIKVMPTILLDPSPSNRGQKIFGSMSCPYVLFQILWFLTSPSVAHAMGSKDVWQLYVIRVGRVSNQALWFYQPRTRFTVPAGSLHEYLFRYK